MQLEANDADLPRRRRAPARYQVCSSTVVEIILLHLNIFIATITFECLDLIILFIRDRFDQPGNQILNDNLPLKSAKNDDYQSELEFVLDFYKVQFIKLESSTSTFNYYIIDFL